MSFGNRLQTLRYRALREAFLGSFESISQAPDIARMKLSQVARSIQLDIVNVLC